MMEACGLQAPHPLLSAVPQRQDVKRGSVISHGTLASGGFGWVSTGVHAQTGKPLAIKEHRAKTLRAQANIVREMDIGESINVSIKPETGRTKLPTEITPRSCKDCFPN